MSRLVVALAGAATLAGIVATHSWLRLHEVRAQIAAVRARISELQSAQLVAGLQVGAPPTSASPSASLPAVQQAGTVPPPAPPTAKPAGAGEQSAAEAFARAYREQLATPEGREMLFMQARMSIPEMYPGVGRELGLAPAELEKFFDVLARQQSDRAAETMAISDSQPQDAAARQELQRKLAQLQQTSEAEVKSTLGGKYPQWQEYQKTLPTRRQVGELQVSLGSGANALSDSQARPLITALAAEQTRIQEDRRIVQQPVATNAQARREAQQQRRSEEIKRLLNAAASYLTPQQLEGYRRMLERDENLSRRMQSIVVPTNP